MNERRFISLKRLFSLDECPCLCYNVGRCVKESLNKYFDLIIASLKSKGGQRDAGPFPAL